MAEKDYDPYELESGLSDIDYVFKGVRFAFDADYNDGGTCLLIVEDGVQTLDEQVEERRNFWPCGTGWEPAEGGKSCRHATKKKFNAESGIGMLLASALEAGAGDVMRKRGSPMQAATWEGLDFHMTNKEFSFKRDGQEQKYTRLLVDQFNGEAKKARATRKATAPKAPAGDEVEADTEVDEPASNGAVPKALELKLKKLAAKVIADDGDFDQFVEDAFDIDGVADDSDVEEALEGIFAKAEANA